jgi:hypothetical protein
MTQTRVNIRTAVNSAGIRKERRNGRDVIIVPSATLPDNVVMNRIRYPADEIAKSYHTLNMKPAPLGHPEIEGAFVSASDPRGMVRGFIGAWNENVRRENGRVFLDKIIDVEYASNTTGGKAVLEAINKGQPIHTSTGLYAMMLPLQNDADADSMATDIVFDHDAILLGEEGAATPAQGVGMLVNKAVAGNGEQVAVVNSSLEEEADERIDWAVSYLSDAIDRREKVGKLTKLKSAIMEALGLSEREPDTTQQKDADMADDKQLEALSAQVNTLSESVTKALDGIKSLTDAQAAIVANQNAKDEAELADLRAKIVKANLLPEAAAGELTLNAARALAPKAEAGKAAGLHNGFAPQGEADTFKLPKVEG